MLIDRKFQLYIIDMVLKSLLIVALIKYILL